MFQGFQLDAFQQYLYGYRVSTKLNAVAIVWYLLSHDSGLLAEVPISRIRASDLPLKTQLPAITIRQRDGFSYAPVDGSSANFWTETVEVMVMADNYPDVKTILRLVQAALPLSRGSVNGTYCDSVLDDLVGPDIYDIQTNIYSQSQQFKVKYTTNDF